MESFEDYLKKGWDNISNDYIKNISKEKIAKERTFLNYKPELVLKLLGSFREFYIDTLFKKFNRKRENYYLAFGSTNILSDYDITIIGPNACSIAEKIYKTYLSEYKKTMAYSFDTNVYVAGFYYYSPSLINPYLKDNIFIFKDKKKNLSLFNFQPINQYQKELSLSFVFLKLLSISSKNVLFTDLKKKSKEFQKTLTPSPTIEKSYELMFENAKKLFSYLYSSKEKDLDLIFELVCKTQYYSIESYYTPSTVNIIVLLIQGKFNLKKLDPFNHICSILENLGDLNNHWKHSGKKNSDFMKVSKYIYRIYYSLYKLNFVKNSLEKVQKSILNRDNKLKFEIKPFFTFIGYREKEKKSLNLFIKELTSIVIDIIFNKNKDKLHL